jgi:hypothetical protein
VKYLPPLHQVKAARKATNFVIEEKLGVTASDSIIRATVANVLALVLELHDVEKVKFAFDHRRNEGRDEVLACLIPVVKKTEAQHSAHIVYPLMLFVGKEEQILELGWYFTFICI